MKKEQHRPVWNLKKNDFIPLPDDACYASLHSDGIDLASEVVAES